MTTTINLPDGYGLVLAAAGSIGLVQFGLGGMVMGFRKAFSSKEFLEKPEVKAIQENHKKDFGTTINNNGYPDMGNGRYSQHLSYAQWVNFNNAQRGHYNMVESSAPVLTALVLNGLFLPQVSAGLGFLYAIGRVVYALGYQTKSGADGRSLGAAFGGIAQISLYGLLFYNGYVSYVRK